VGNGGQSVKMAAASQVVVSPNEVEDGKAGKVFATTFDGHRSLPGSQKLNDNSQLGEKTDALRKK